MNAPNDPKQPNLVAKYRAEDAVSQDHQILVCNATTGHAYKVIAMCDTADQAEVLARSARALPLLIMALKVARLHIPQSGMMNPQGPEPFTLDPEVEKLLKEIDAAIAMGEGQ